MRHLIILIIIFNFSPLQRMVLAYSDSPECETVTHCPLEKECKCTVSPTFAYDRYYYAQFAEIKKGTGYQCQFSSTPVLFTIVPSESIFPIGASYQYSPPFRVFPITLSLNTKQMVAKSGLMKIKIFVPASDYPSNLIVQCNKVTKIVE